jgi:hypothetical protein
MIFLHVFIHREIRDMKALRKFSLLLFIIWIVVSNSFFSGCAGVMNTMQSGDSEIIDEGSPYFFTFSKSYDLTEATVGHLPVVVDETWLNSENKHALTELSSEMTALLDSVRWTIPLNVKDLPRKGIPYVYFGNAENTTTEKTYEKEFGRTYLMLRILNSSRTWIDSVFNLIENENIDYILFISLGRTEYFAQSTGKVGENYIDMGTGYELPIKELVALNAPIPVLQIKGALIDRKGTILRAGAEGILPLEPSKFKVSKIKMDNILTEKDIQKMMVKERRNNLPKSPLTWQICLQNLTANLLERKELILK